MDPIFGSIIEDVSKTVIDYLDIEERMNVTTTSSLNYSRAEPKEVVVRYVIGVVELLVFLIGTPSNCLVIYLTYHIFRRRGRYQRDGDCSFRHGQWLVFTMATFDLLFCLIHSPMMFAMYMLVEQLPHNYYSCMVMHFATHSSTTGSSLSLLALNVEKFVRLYKPLHYRSLITKWRTVTASLFIWIISISWSIFLLFGPSVDHKVSTRGQCNLQIKHSGIYALFASQFFILPTMISLVISVFTMFAALRIRRHRRYPVVQEIIKPEHQKLRRASFPHNNSTSTLRSNDRMAGKGKDQKCMSLMRLIGFVFTTTVWTSVTTLPYRIGYVLLATNRHLLTRPNVVCMFYLLCAMVMNAAGNPFITIATKRQYSMSARQILLKMSRRRLFNGSCDNLNSTSDMTGKRSRVTMLSEKKPEPRAKGSGL